jgi:hypothetical protein
MFIFQNPHALSQLYAFANLCENSFTPEVIMKAIDDQCEAKIHHHDSITGIH